MGDFAPAYTKTKRREGGYRLSDHPDDIGKRTFAGIAEYFWPDWAGWDMIASEGITTDSDSPAPSDKLKRQVALFYKREFWSKARCGEIVDQRMAEDFYDYTINAGIGKATRTIQACIGANVDGRIGPNTIAKINQAVETDAENLAMLFALSKLANYARSADKKKSQAQFMHGWVNRVLDVVQGG